MIKVKVFPDHMSSGLWDEAGTNMSESEVSHVLDEKDLWLLKYWHEMWEFCIAEDRMSQEYVDRWNEDGQRMVDRWNAKQNEIEFVYVGCV